MMVDPNGIAGLDAQFIRPHVADRAADSGGRPSCQGIYWTGRASGPRC